MSSTKPQAKPAAGAGTAAAAAGVHKKKAALMSLEKHLGRQVVVTVAEDRELRGVLKGFDSNMNLVLGETVEHTVVDDVPCRRPLGAAIVRGPTVIAVCRADSLKEIPNPF
jgi:small nuclear ribonucleoprotein (snRNP)-like protein